MSIHPRDYPEIQVSTFMLTSMAGDNEVNTAYVTMQLIFVLYMQLINYCDVNVPEWMNMCLL